jgi:predicted phosphate transport protein (TIGR00153 family)
MEHMKKVRECVQLLRPLFVSVSSGDRPEVERLSDLISHVEHEADKIKNDIRDHLPRSYFMPVQRSDILGFLKEQDAMADSAEDVAVLVTMRQMAIPEECREMLMSLVEKVLETCQFSFEATSEFKSLLESGFGGPEVEKVIKMVERVSLGEWEADTIQMDVARRLFQIENKLEPLSVALWVQVFGELGKLANHAENTADILRMMISRG